ncbi:small, acid-soluble spore protein, alpha/beta type [Agathobaculum butyriciproducens]|nr:small, acid-soluble spore protein, alpha/beta type [Butyricicoccus sp. OM06-6AC]RGC56145.1 small, acid-soluble spore protein, alpha/beta type [Agathobaculum butyriciproducens]RGC60283.1 small, acid-soluble spore protein, alpha/beta type [Agathobaculum butyriciproducens]RGM79321.1 small, acid-soluble spore protein, alpha/beta type [Butyricicoccus sp. OM06-6AC]
MTNTKNGSNQGMVPEARAAMDRFKMEAAATLVFIRHKNCGDF